MSMTLALALATFLAVPAFFGLLGTGVPGTAATGRAVQSVCGVVMLVWAATVVLALWQYHHR